MRHLLSVAALTALVSAPVLAADIPSRSAVPVPPPMAESFSWNGFYFGADAGYTKGRARWTDITGYNGVGESFSYRPRGFTGNLHMGYNLQAGLMVYGLEAEAGYLGLKRAQQYPNFVGNRSPLDSVAETTDGKYAALSARLGLAIDSFMIYGRGGLVISDVRQKFTDNDAAGAVLVEGVTTKRPRTGYTFGGGVALALSQNLSARAEYNYYYLGNKTHTAVSNWGAPLNFRHSLSTNVFRLGLDYKFGGSPAAPVIAKY